MIALKPTTKKGKSSSKAARKAVSKPGAMPATERILVYDSAQMLTLSHVIEDLASEIGSGDFISTFQHFANFEPQRARYAVLGSRLANVRVWGNGKIPKPVEGIDFIHADDLRVANYWMVLFESERVSALLLCRQKNKTDVFPKKKFVGFYTFNPFLVESVRRHFNLLTSGLPGLVEQWEKLIDLP